MTTSETLPPGAMGAFFDVPALMASFPAAAGPMLLDIRLSDEPAASSRIFRVYRPVPPHYHAAESRKGGESGGQRKREGEGRKQA